MNEQSSFSSTGWKIPYHSAATLPKACCKEIENCQLLVSIIGGRYGSTVEVVKEKREGGDNEGNAARSAIRAISISQLEVEHAVQSGLLIFTFVDAGVLGERQTYLANKGSVALTGSGG